RGFRPVQANRRAPPRRLAAPMVGARRLARTGRPAPALGVRERRGVPAPLPWRFFVENPWGRRNEPNRPAPFAGAPEASPPGPQSASFGGRPSRVGPAPPAESRERGGRRSPPDSSVGDP